MNCSPKGANSFNLEQSPFQQGFGVLESKKEVSCLPCKNGADNLIISAPFNYLVSMFVCNIGLPFKKKKSLNL